MYQRTLLIILLGVWSILVAVMAAEEGATEDSAGVSPPYLQDPYPSTYHPIDSGPTAIVNATILDGNGGLLEEGSLLISDGKIAAIGRDIDIPDEVSVVDADGKWVTPGIIDIHSHIGVSGRQHPTFSDGNEMTGPNQSRVWVEHSLWPQHPGFVRALAGGVTTLQILPGSGNLFGGRSVIVKNVPARTMQAMKFPDAPYGLKMACGENPKRAYGSQRKAPATRMANVAGFRTAFIEAGEYKREWDDFVAGKGGNNNGEGEEKDGDEKQGKAPKRDLGKDTLAAVLAGDIFVNIHCYRADELAVMMDLAREMDFTITAFHHTIEAYKVADLLAENDICAVMWSDWWGYKAEALDAIPEGIALVDRAGGCAIAHSDSEGVVQHMNLEVAKAMASGNRAGMDLTRQDAFKWISSNPARAMRIDDQVGSLDVGKDADVVIWSDDPFSIYSLAEEVYIDGALVYDRDDPERTPQSDYELGIIKRGDF